MGWEMLIEPVIDAGMTVISGNKAGKREGANRGKIRLENNEEIRRAKLQFEQSIGSATALSGGSGVSMKSKSIEDYLDQMRDNFKKDLDWMEKARDMGIRLSGQRQSDLEKEAQLKAAATVAKGIGRYLQSRPEKDKGDKGDKGGKN